jgi:Asp-tRNA(Asn)/Glu-tRNA(Gln) amidotransferase A subunit family amidase
VDSVRIAASISTRACEANSEQSPGQPIIHSVVGIMSHSLEDIRLMFEALLTTEPWKYDSNMLPISWRTETATCEERSAPLCFGILMDDGEVIPHPPISRALRIVQAALESEGHSVRQCFQPMSLVLTDTTDGTLGSAIAPFSGKAPGKHLVKVDGGRPMYLLHDHRDM